MTHYYFLSLKWKNKNKTTTPTTALTLAYWLWITRDFWRTYLRLEFLNLYAERVNTGLYGVFLFLFLSAGHDNAGHDNAGHDNAGHDNAGHDNAGHDNTGLSSVFFYYFWTHVSRVVDNMDTRMLKFASEWMLLVVWVLCQYGTFPQSGNISVKRVTFPWSGNILHIIRNNFALLPDRHQLKSAKLRSFHRIELGFKSPKA